MDDGQTVFGVFFAIVWGGILNVAWRWQMFQPLWHGRILLRIVLSIVFMMVLPIVFFSYHFNCDCFGFLWSWVDVVAAVLPSFSVFAFYRWWMAIVGRWPDCFYWSVGEYVPDYRLRCVDPSQEKMRIHLRIGYWGNCIAGVLYALVAVGGPWVINRSGLIKCVST